jgi:hypothetical protein
VVVMMLGHGNLLDVVRQCQMEGLSLLEQKGCSAAGVDGNTRPVRSTQ